MPLTLSPIDGAPMRQIHRYGIEFDVCPTTGGVWLDKGELDKLIALVREETLNERHGESDRRYDEDKHREHRQSRDGKYRDDDDDDDYKRNRHGGGRRSRLADLFDF